MAIDFKLEFYPENRDEDTHPYHVEFSTWDGEKWMWKLFKSSGKLPGYQVEWLGPKYGHPFNLGEGYLEDERCVSLHTRQFLKFLVDSLNEKTANDKKL